MKGYYNLGQVAALSGTMSSVLCDLIRYVCPITKIPTFNAAVVWFAPILKATPGLEWGRFSLCWLRHNSSSFTD